MRTILIIIVLFIMGFVVHHNPKNAYEAYCLEYNITPSEESYTYFLDVFTSTNAYDELLNKYNL